MRVLFVGSTKLGHSCLEALLTEENVSVCGILTAPKEFRISYAPEGVQNVLHTDFRPLSSRAGCPLLVLDGKMSSPSLFEEVRELRPDCILVVGWHHMVPKSWLAEWPTFGIHASSLPKYAGGAPVVWAMIEGQRHIGVTLFQFDSGVDSGPIVGQSRVKVGKNDDISVVLDKLETEAVRLVCKEVPKILTPLSPRRRQPLEGRKVYPQRKPDDGSIESTMSLKQVRNFVRAQTRPYPGAYIKVKGTRLTVWRLGKTRRSTRPRHDVYLFRNSLYLGRGRRSIEIIEYSLPSSVTLEDVL